MGETEDAGARWMRHMRRGEMSAAWAIADETIAREETWLNLPPEKHLRPVWRGQPVEGRRVLVRCHHGLGDTIQFVRYIPRLGRVASGVTLAAQSPLIQLLKGMPCLDHLIELEEAYGEEGCGVELEITELPHLFRDTLETIPADVPYIAVPPAEREPRLPGQRVVGIVHQAGDWDQRRSVPPELLDRLEAVSGVQMINLQRGSARIHVPRGFGIPEGERDLLEIAALFRSLDLLVTVDTMAAHLAGALAVPTWTLLHSEPDWRWLEDRSDSPWYPTMRLYRQQTPGDWEGVLQDVVRDLRELELTA